MARLVRFLLLIGANVVASGSLEAQITYPVVPVSLFSGYQIESGFIQTDGTLGYINDENILDYRILQVVRWGTRYPAEIGYSYQDFSDLVPSVHDQDFPEEQLPLTVARIPEPSSSVLCFLALCTVLIVKNHRISSSWIC